jgi:predicted methyltransferase MtxX (methanogen marker protein 4)
LFRLYSNLHNATAWNQLGFKFSIVNEGRIDTYSVTLALQKIDNDRLVEKNLKIQKKIAAHGLRRYKRDAKVALFGPGSVQSEEGLKFAKLRYAIHHSSG